VGELEEAYSKSCGLSWVSETPQAPKATRRLSVSPAESEAHGTEINGLLLHSKYQNLSIKCWKYDKKIDDFFTSQ
jgi:hypothetical protein